MIGAVDLLPEPRAWSFPAREADGLIALHHAMAEAPWGELAGSPLIGLRTLGGFLALLDEPWSGLVGEQLGAAADSALVAETPTTPNPSARPYRSGREPADPEPHRRRRADGRGPGALSGRGSWLERPPLHDEPAARGLAAVIGAGRASSPSSDGPPASPLAAPGHQERRGRSGTTTVTAAPPVPGRAAPARSPHAFEPALSPGGPNHDPAHDVWRARARLAGVEAHWDRRIDVPSVAPESPASRASATAPAQDVPIEQRLEISLRHLAGAASQPAGPPAPPELGRRAEPDHPAPQARRATTIAASPGDAPPRSVEAATPDTPAGPGPNPFATADDRPLRGLRGLAARAWAEEVETAPSDERASGSIGEGTRSPGPPAAVALAATRSPEPSGLPPDEAPSRPLEGGISATELNRLLTAEARRAGIDLDDPGP